MYSLEAKEKAVLLFFKYDKSPTAVMKELGYPDYRTLIKWVDEYVANDCKFIETSNARYSSEEKIKAVDHYLSHGRCISRTIRELGYPSNGLLRTWIMELAPEQLRIYSNTKREFSFDEKIEAVLDLDTRTETAAEVARKHDISRTQLYKWKKDLIKDKTEVISDTNELQQEVETLKKEIYKLRLEKDLLEGAMEILKKDLGINLKNLTNKEKTILIDAYIKKYSLDELLTNLSIPRSCYFYHLKRLSNDKYKKEREIIKNIFYDNKKRFGYRRIYIEYKNKYKKTLSEKVIRRIMTEENLKVINVSMKKYSSYKGEITPAVPNLLKRKFIANRPNEKWLTDITEFHIPAGKIYLSPLIDCYDGLAVAWTIGLSPGAELANTMLQDGISILKPGEKPLVHSDRGFHYRTKSWIEIMDKAGLTRSMSKKGCSPDNSACEAFFGRLKQEFFYGRDWSNTTLDEFMYQLDEYVAWYNTKRIKLKFKCSILENRKKLGLAV